MLYIGLAETSLLHPANAIGAGIVEASWRFDEHVEAHQQTKYILRSIVVDHSVVDHECATGIQRSIGFGHKHFLLGKIPIVQDVPHGKDVDCGQWSAEEITGLKTKTTADAVRLCIFFEDRSDFGKVKTDSLQVRISQRDLHSQVSLRCSQVGVCLVLRPWYLARNREVCSVADAGHGCEKCFEARRIGVQGGERRCTGVTLGLVLQLAGTKRLGQMVPEAVESGVRHLQDAADITRLVAIKKKICIRSIAIAILRAVQKAQSHQRVQKIACCTRMQPQAACESVELLGTMGKFGEDTHFDGAEQRLR